MFFSDAVDTAAENVSKTVNVDWQQVINTIVNWCTTTGLKIIFSIIIMIISFKFINFFTKRLLKRLTKKKTDPTISRTLCSFLRICLKILVVAGLVGYVGVETASISAVLASAGVGLSLAIQGTLSNFAGGVIIVIMRPFKLGDFITSNGESGTVEDIKLFYTTIISPDNKTIFIPNSKLANDVIVNISTKPTRRVEVIMPVSYDADTEKAMDIMKEVALANQLVLTNPEPFVRIKEYDDSSINLVCRVWCNNSDYWNVYFYLLSEIKKQFDNNGIVLPFNQLDVTIKNKE